MPQNIGSQKSFAGTSLLSLQGLIPCKRTCCSPYARGGHSCSLCLRDVTVFPVSKEEIEHKKLLVRKFPEKCIFHTGR